MLQNTEIQEKSPVLELLESSGSTARHHPRSKESGATAVEYALLVAFIALVIIGTVRVLGQDVAGLYDQVCPAFNC